MNKYSIDTLIIDGNSAFALQKGRTEGIKLKAVLDTSTEKQPAPYFIARLEVTQITGIELSLLMSQYGLLSDADQLALSKKLETKEQKRVLFESLKKELEHES